MIQVRPFKAADLGFIPVQGRHQQIRNDLIASGRAKMLEGPFSWTAVERVKLSPAHVRICPIACAGIWLPPHRQHRPGLAWAFLGGDLRRQMVVVTRKVRVALEACPRPVIAEIDPGFPEAVRWAKLLGFVPYGRWTWIYDAHLCGRS